jgi:hypothetical protein
MSTQTNPQTTDQSSLSQQLWEMILGFQVSQLIHVVATLWPRMCSGQPKSCEDLAQAVRRSHALSLCCGCWQAWGSLRNKKTGANLTPGDIPADGRAWLGARHGHARGEEFWRPMAPPSYRPNRRDRLSPCVWHGPL